MRIVTWNLKYRPNYITRKKKYRSFAELLQHAPGAEQLHFFTSAAVTSYLQQLNETIPDILNNLGKHCLKFNQYQFEIINSDLQDKTKHMVALNFYSEPLVWHDTIGNYLLVSDEPAAGEVLTNLFQLQLYLSIHTLQMTL